MQIERGSARVVLVFNNYVIKLPRFLRWFGEARESFSCKTLKRNYGFRKRICSFFKKLFIPVKDNWYEFIFYKKTHNKFCAKSYFSFFGLFNIQERVMHLKGSNPKDPYHFLRKEEYDFILNAVFIGRKQDVDGHTFCSPINFGFSKKRHEFVCLDYADPMVQSNILEFGEMLQKAFRDFDKK